MIAAIPTDPPGRCKIDRPRRLRGGESFRGSARAVSAHLHAGTRRPKTFLPAVARALIIAGLLRPEARLLHAHMRAAVGRRQRPGDDGLDAGRRLVARSIPAIGRGACAGSTTSTSQSTTPFQCGIGAARKLNRWPTTGWKSFCISHSSISGRLRERAPDLFRRMRHLSFDDERCVSRWRVRSLIHPVQQVFEGIEPVAPEGAVERHPVDQRLEALRLGAVMGLPSLVAGRAPGRRASGRRDVWTPRAATRRIGRSAPARSARRRAPAARRSPGGSDRRGF